MLDLHRLRLLREVHARGTVSAAAAALGYSTSSVSQQLSVLEREAGAMLLEKAVGAKVTMVQYKGSAPAYVDIQSRRVDLMCDSTGGSVAQVKGGAVKAFVVTGNKRLESLPAVPYSSEAGLADLAAMTVWYALFAPAGTPKPVVDRLVSALQASLADATFRGQLASWDATPYETKYAQPAALRERMSSQVDMWTKLIRDAGIQPQ